MLVSYSVPPNVCEALKKVHFAHGGVLASLRFPP